MTDVNFIHYSKQNLIIIHTFHLFQGREKKIYIPQLLLPCRNLLTVIHQSAYIGLNGGVFAGGSKLQLVWPSENIMVMLYSGTSKYVIIILLEICPSHL